MVKNKMLKTKEKRANTHPDTGCGKASVNNDRKKFLRSFCRIPTKAASLQDILKRKKTFGLTQIPTKTRSYKNFFYTSA